MKTVVGDSGRSWRYDEERPIGTPGGFARVFRGLSDDDHEVAVKVAQPLDRGRPLTTALRNRERDIAKTLRERQAAGDHLVIPFDQADDGTKAYIIMELANGSLGDELAASGLTPDKAFDVIRQCALGLAALHQCALIHRDLKPANVLRYDTTYKLTDFGISRDASLGTQPATFKGWGTSEYMAPELWHGLSPTFETDLYALGCLAFEVVAGSPPFSGPEEKYEGQHCTEAPPALPQTLSPGLKSLITRLLRKEPSDRFQNAEQVVRQLERLRQPLGAVHEALVESSSVHAREKAEAEAKAAEKARLATQHRTNLRRAKLDLQESFEAALLSIQTALPDVRLQHSNGVEAVKLTNDDAELTVELWPWVVVPPDGNAGAPVAVGGVRAKNRRISGIMTTILANIVYEEVGGAYEWVLYRFTDSPTLRSYDLGPRGTPHGFPLETFRKQRPYMSSQAMHIWSLVKSALTDEAIAGLFNEALRLQG